mmetsp:Transcript_24333/g.59583  ORF Transcript_24333/g.59583 Transcript_24333/m.59583 type:complete len:235 (+) Transcript_24333:862-1566(+)
MLETAMDQLLVKLVDTVSTTIKLINDGSRAIRRSAQVAFETLPRPLVFPFPVAKRRCDHLLLVGLLLVMPFCPTRLDPTVDPSRHRALSRVKATPVGNISRSGNQKGLHVVIGMSRMYSINSVILMLLYSVLKACVCGADIHRLTFTKGGILQSIQVESRWPRPGCFFESNLCCFIIKHKTRNFALGGFASSTGLQFHPRDSIDNAPWTILRLSLVGMPTTGDGNIELFTHTCL